MITGMRVDDTAGNYDSGMLANEEMLVPKTAPGPAPVSADADANIVLLPFIRKHKNISDLPTMRITASQ